MFRIKSKKNIASAWRLSAQKRTVEQFECGHLAARSGVARQFPAT
jgi:hypothetical protein